jgi:site-specific DNA-methyltransferase (adenine-specific)
MEVLKDLEDNSIDSVVSDPPYGLSQISTQVFNECMLKWCTDDRSFMPSSKGFMGKSWDSFVPPPSLWDEVYRVLKPGGHALIFAGSRTQDLMGLSLRLAGFEMRDCIQWIYGSGFPKSLNIGKAIDKTQGNEREIIRTIKKTHYSTSNSNEGWKRPSHYDSNGSVKKIMEITAPSSKEAKQWEGWGTALKPAYEPALLVRKPFRGSVAQNVLEYGVGGINVDGGRIDYRWPSNIIIGEDVEKDLTKKHGIKTSGEMPLNFKDRDSSTVQFLGKTRIHSQSYEINKGSVSRYFYCAKASKEERERGLDGFELKKAGAMRGEETRENKPSNHPMRKNIHPTVKPIDLMRYLCRLITPPKGTVLDPFMGSGSTGIGAIKEGFDFIGIEREEEYFEIAKTRIEYWTSIDLSYEDNEEKPVDSQLSLFG